MNPHVPNGRPPLASPAQIIETWKRTKSISKVCKECHAGSDRVEGILDRVGIKHSPRRYDKRVEGPMPEHYMLAISAYVKGAPTKELRKTYGVSLSKLYQWMTQIGVARRTPKHLQKEWRCWKCGVEVANGELFCGDKHRREYSASVLAPDARLVTPRMVRQEKAKREELTAS